MTNVHHQDWLCSTHTSTAGRSLIEFCEYNGLSQLVTESTQGDATLDLIIKEHEGHVLYCTDLGTSDHVSLTLLEIILSLPSQTVFH